MLNEDLEQRKLFNKLYKITDQAIDKAVSFQDIDGLSASQNELIREIYKLGLRILSEFKSVGYYMHLN